MSAAIPYVLAIVVAIFSFMEARLVRKNRKLKARLRQALLDCRAFYEIEARMADTIATFAEYLPSNEYSGSLLAVKRYFRARIRLDGMQSPSDRATPHQIGQELAKL